MTITHDSYGPALTGVVRDAPLPEFLRDEYDPDPVMLAMGALRVAASGLYVGDAVRVTRSNSMTFQTPVHDALGTIVSVSARGALTVYLDDGPTLTVVPGVNATVTKVSGPVDPTGRTTGRWQVRAVYVTYDWHPGEPAEAAATVQLWRAEPIPASDELDEDVLAEYGARAFGAAEYSHAAAYAAAQARRFLR